MLKFVILLAIITAVAAQYIPYATPVVGVRPGLAPADVRVVAREFVSYRPEHPSVYPSVYSGAHIPFTYASNYVAYKAPLEASSYQISY